MTLNDYLTFHNLTNAAFALKLGTTAETVRRWRNRECFPQSEQVFRQIYEATGRQVTANDFYNIPPQNRTGGRAPVPFTPADAGAVL